MRLVVVDPLLLLKGALVADSRARRLLVLLYYGHEANFVRLYETGERTPIEPRLSSRSVEVGGPSYERLVAASEDRAAFLQSRLPPGMPDDLGLVLSSPILRLLDRAAKRVRGLVPNLDPVAVRHRVLTTAAVLVALEEADPIRGWRPFSRRRPREVDHDRAVLLATASAAEGYLVVSDDPELVHDDARTEYLDPRSSAEVTALRLDVFVGEFLSLGELLDEIDPALLGATPTSAHP